MAESCRRKSSDQATTDESSVLTTVQCLQKEGFKDITVADRRANRTNGRAGGKFEWSGLNDRAEAGGFATDSLMDDGEAPARPAPGHLRPPAARRPSRRSRGRRPTRPVHCAWR